MSRINRKTPSRRYPAIIMFGIKRLERKFNTVNVELSVLSSRIRHLECEIALLKNPPANKLLDRVDFLSGKDVLEGVVTEVIPDTNGKPFYRVMTKDGNYHYVDQKDIMVNHEEVLAKRKAK